MANLDLWYARLSQLPETFEQGDLFENAIIPMVGAVDLTESVEIPTRKGSFVVLTQSCDVPKTPALLMAEVYPYRSLVAAANRDAHVFRSSKTIEALIRNRLDSWFLLPPPPTLEAVDSSVPNWQLASFRHLHVVSSKVLARLAAERLPIRMSSPYKEFLGESFARFMMRVALPEPLDEFRNIPWSKLEA